MDYKLAKQLKDAGFPQGDYSENYEYLSDNKSIWCDGVNKEYQDKVVRLPLLEEVIEELGDKFKGLLPPSEILGSWQAIEKIGTIDENRVWKFWSFISGKTPLEAVCNLYIKIK